METGRRGFFRKITGLAAAGAVLPLVGKSAAAVEPTRLLQDVAAGDLEIAPVFMASPSKLMSMSTIEWERELYYNATLKCWTYDGKGKS